MSNISRRFFSLDFCLSMRTNSSLDFSDFWGFSKISLGGIDSEVIFVKIGDSGIN